MRQSTLPTILTRRRFLGQASALTAVGACPTLTNAQHADGWPARPVRVLVGSNAGSPIDVPTRGITHRLSARFSQPFVVENRAGAGGILAAEAVVKAVPDGYTLLSAGPAEIINNYFIWQNAGRAFPYDPAKDLAPIAMIQRGPGVLVVGAKLGIATWSDLADYLRRNPGKGSIGVVQLGASTHLASELLKRESKLDFVVVPYRGMAEMLSDLREARLTMMLSTPFETIDFVRQGTLKALAVSHTRRIEGFEAVPTFGELGLPEVVNLPFLGLYAPASTPPAIVAKLNRAVAEEIAGSPPGKPALTPFGREAPVMSPAELKDYIAKERERWGRVIQEANIRI